MVAFSAQDSFLPPQGYFGSLTMPSFFILEAGASLYKKINFKSRLAP
jgi:hypothetical protein